MRQYQVEVSRMQSILVEVEAESEEAAKEAGIDAALSRDDWVDGEPYVESVDGL